LQQQNIHLFEIRECNISKYLYNSTMKKLSFLGSSLDDLREFPPSVKSEAGYQLGRVQSGVEPDDFKPMPTIGKGVSKRLRELLQGQKI
jgi:phage-related protein